MNKRPITVNETELNVEEYDPWPQSPQFNTVQVSGIPRDVELGYLQFYFKDTEKSGGDKSATVKYNDGDTVAYITFETEEGMLS